MVLGVVLLPACSSDSPTELNSAELPGFYNLTEISGQSPPVVIRESNLASECLRGGESGNLTESISGGFLQLTESGRFTLHMTLLQTCTYPSSEAMDPRIAATDGDFTVQHGALLLEPERSGWSDLTAEGIESGFAFSVQIPGDVVTRRYVLTRCTGCVPQAR